MIVDENSDAEELFYSIADFTGMEEMDLGDGQNSMVSGPSLIKDM